MRWLCAEIRKVAEVQSGFGFPLEHQVGAEGELPFFKVGDMNTPGNERAMYHHSYAITAETAALLRARPFPPGTTIFPKIGAAIATNKKRMLVKPSIVDNNVMGLIPNSNIDPCYLYYWTLQFDLSTISNIGPVPSIRKSEIERIILPLPPLSEQRRIVEFLDQGDALRKKRAEADTKAQRILPALFYGSFGDPVLNPRGWEMVPLGQLSPCGPEYGANASAAEWVPGSPRYVRITDILPNGRLAEGGRVTLSLNDWHPYKLEWGDLLFARSGATAGKTCLYLPSDGLCAFAGYLIRFRLDQDQVDPWYAFALTKTGYYRNWVESVRRTAAQPNINGQEYSALLVPKPPIELQRNFAKAAATLLSIEVDTSSSANKIETLYLAILHRAFSGELTARWRQAHMKELLKEMEIQASYLRESTE